MTRTARSQAQIALSLVLVLAMVLGAGWAVQSQKDAQAWVRHTLEVETSIQRVMLLVTEAEANQRSYLLTGDPRYRDRYSAARAALPAAQDRVRALTSDDTPEQVNLSGLTASVDERMQIAFATMAVRDAEGGVGNPKIRQMLDRGTAAMDVVRHISAGILQDEEKLLDARARAAANRALFAQASLAVVGGTLLIVGWLLLLNGQSQIDELRKSEAELRRINEMMQAEADARQKAEEQVRHMHRIESIGQLTGGIAHDFNNMLAVVIGSLEMSLKRLGDGGLDRAKAYIRSALEASEHATQLTSRLLAFSRKQALNPQVLDPNHFVAGVSEMLRRTLGETVRVETVLAGGLWKVCADAAQLENAILNLALNARDAMPDGGRLTIETSNTELDEGYALDHAEVVAGQYVLIGVTDTGSGMPPEVLDRIFEPFFTTKGVGKGTGLGLSQVYGFVKQSGGHISAYSEPGKGTTIRLYLRRDTSNAEQAQLKPASGGLKATDHQIVLVVEDDERVRHVTTDYLRELGYTVLSAEGGAQALSIMQVQPKVDLLFTDVVMPEMNGQELAEEVRRRWPATRILFTTGYTRNAVVHNGILDPGVNLISKPFRRDQLARKLREVLGAEARQVPFTEVPEGS